MSTDTAKPVIKTESAMEEIRDNEVLVTPQDAIDVLRRVPNCKNISRATYSRAVEILDEYLKQPVSAWK